MLLRQHLDIFTALQNRDGDAVEKAMTLHLQEIGESVRLIRQRTVTGLVKINTLLNTCRIQMIIRLITKIYNCFTSDNRHYSF